MKSMFHLNTMPCLGQVVTMTFLWGYVHDSSSILRWPPQPPSSLTHQALSNSHLRTQFRCHFFCDLPDLSKLGRILHSSPPKSCVSLYHRMTTIYFYHQITCQWSPGWMVEGMDEKNISMPITSKCLFPAQIFLLRFILIYISSCCFLPTDYPCGHLKVNMFPRTFIIFPPTMLYAHVL